MSTTFDIRRWATQAGIQTTGGFAVIAECVTMDELQRFAEIAIASAGGVQALSAAPKASPQQEAQEPTEVPYQKLTNEIDLILSDPDTELSIGAKRALLWMRTWVSVPLFTAPQQEAPVADEFQPCPSCFGTGVEGDADDYGRTIDVSCGDCNGSGRAQVEAATEPDTAPRRYREACTQGGRCLGGCFITEPCYLTVREMARAALAAQGEKDAG